MQVIAGGWLRRGVILLYTAPDRYPLRLKVNSFSDNFLDRRSLGSMFKS